ncbi:HU family DNA-binding protein [Microbispora triticiradicis]|uniref:HU family DNA-binding protein n=1 Tax=Microbispora triticiradicis TaxID=2200763 RepID=UPI001AD7C708|nr:HU family DNA-binding protein [Microbispora triticiradicis]MBO4275162.1 hypothetical protein [Microbispora triticiradicis]
MNKTQLVAKVTETTGLPQAAVNAAITAVFGAIQETVATGEEVQIIGFGSFKRGFVAGRTTKHLHTKEPIQIGDSWTPKFKAGDEFKRTVKAAA